MVIPELELISFLHLKKLTNKQLKSLINEHSASLFAGITQLGSFHGSKKLSYRHYIYDDYDECFRVSKDFGVFWTSKDGRRQILQLLFYDINQDIPVFIGRPSSFNNSILEANYSELQIVLHLLDLGIFESGSIAYDLARVV